MAISLHLAELRRAKTVKGNALSIGACRFSTAEECLQVSTCKQLPMNPNPAVLAGVECGVRQLLDVVRAGVGALQGCDAHGHRTPPHTRVGVHSSVREGP